jgi:LPXTG-motif cell wall-anchored protein
MTYHATGQWLAQTTPSCISAELKQVATNACNALKAAQSQVHGLGQVTLPAGADPCVYAALPICPPTIDPTKLPPAPIITQRLPPPPPPTETPTEEKDGADSSLVIGGIVLLLALGGGYLYYRSRKK